MMNAANSVANLKFNKFHKMDLDEKIYIKKLGRPTPDLKITHVYTRDGRTYLKRFDRKIYEGNDWICGCDDTNGLYCFPCILYGGVPAWTLNGVTDLGLMSSKIDKHTRSKTHRWNVEQLALLKKNDTLSSPNSVDERESVPKTTNEEAVRNIRLFSKLIDCIVSCKDVLNFPQLGKLLERIFDSEPDVKAHMENVSKFNWNSEKFEDEVLNCISNVVREYIATEIHESPFLSIMVNGTSNISPINKAALILRYVKNNEVVERFWCFLHPSAEDPHTVSECILFELEQILRDFPGKLVAQSYDGSPIMRKVHLIIKKVYFNALYIHSYAHSLHSVVENVVSQITDDSLQEYPSFLSSSQQVKPSNETIKSNRQVAPLKHSDSKIQTINKVYKKPINMVQRFQERKGTAAPLATEHAVCNLEHLLKDKEFKFWLIFFSYLKPHEDSLSNQLGHLMDSSKIKEAILEFSSNMENFKKVIQEIGNTSTTIDEEEFSVEEIALLKKDALKLCDLIKNEVIERFQFTDHFDIPNIFLTERFPEYEGQFPQKLIDTAVKSFNVFEKDGEKLRSELKALYKTKAFTKVSRPQQFLQFIYEKKLDKTFSETVKLLKLILTLPFATFVEGTSLPNLKRLNKFLRNKKSPEHLTLVFTLHMQKAIISSIPDFKQKVINLFLSSGGRRFGLIRTDDK